MHLSSPNKPCFTGNFFISESCLAAVISAPCSDTKCTLSPWHVPSRGVLKQLAHIRGRAWPWCCREHSSEHHHSCLQPACWGSPALAMLHSLHCSSPVQHALSSPSSYPTAPGCSLLPGTAATHHASLAHIELHFSGEILKRWNLGHHAEIHLE